MNIRLRDIISHKNLHHNFKSKMSLSSLINVKNLFTTFFFILFTKHPYCPFGNKFSAFLKTKYFLSSSVKNTLNISQIPNLFFIRFLIFYTPYSDISTLLEILYVSIKSFRLFADISLLLKIKSVFRISSFVSFSLFSRG